MLPEFVPHPLLRDGHSQTLAANFLRYRPRGGRDQGGKPVTRRVTLPDGDAVVLVDDAPAAWAPGDRAAVLLHGLAGCHQSDYMQRITDKLAARGVRVFRLDLRNVGAAAGLSAKPYNGGCSEDVAAALTAVAQLCPGSPLSLAGFSLGGNIVLRTAAMLGADAGADAAGRTGIQLDRVAAVCPPVDLHQSALTIQAANGRLYDRYLTKRMIADAARLLQAQPTLAASHPLNRRITRIMDFDESFTAPIWGFDGAEHYYATASAGPLLYRIGTPTLIIAAADDPVIAPDQFDNLSLPDCVTLQVTRHGGHLGFLSNPQAVADAAQPDPDWRWMDWRIVEWVLRGE